jgi:hypothetical protein
VQLPQDAAQDLAVVPPGLAAPAVIGQQRLHAGECFVGELEHLPAPGLVASRSTTLSTCTAISSQVRLSY